LALDTTYIRRQVRSDPSPLLITQPEQILAHDPDPLQKTNQDRIVTTQELMSSDPNPLEHQSRCFLRADFGSVCGDLQDPARPAARLERRHSRRCNYDVALYRRKVVHRLLYRQQRHRFELRSCRRADRAAFVGVLLRPDLSSGRGIYKSLREVPQILAL
jgi:hypothetical protein